MRRIAWRLAQLNLLLLIFFFFFFFGMFFHLPWQQRRLFVVCVGQLDVVSNLYRHRGGIVLEEPVDERRRRDLRRRGPASGRHQLVRWRHNRAAEHSQHLQQLEKILSVARNFFLSRKFRAPTMGFPLESRVAVYRIGSEGVLVFAHPRGFYRPIKGGENMWCAGSTWAMNLVERRIRTGWGLEERPWVSIRKLIIGCGSIQMILKLYTGSILPRYSEQCFSGKHINLRIINKGGKPFRSTKL